MAPGTGPDGSQVGQRLIPEEPCLIWEFRASLAGTTTDWG